MAIVRLDHVQLAMPEGREAEARAFYGKLLGLAEIPKTAGLVNRGGAWFESGAVKIHLGVESDFRPARKAHPGLVVDHLDELIRRLRAGGYEVREDKQIEGTMRVFVNDPFGNRIELIAA